MEFLSQPRHENAIREMPRWQHDYTADLAAEAVAMDQTHRQKIPPRIVSTNDQIDCGASENTPEYSTLHERSKTAAGMK